LQILKLMARGMINVQITAEMHLSEKTIKNHISRIFEKMSVSNRSSAIIVGIKAGLIDLDLVEVIEYERFRP
jgi:DNA-binding NarL/FixJ family response regulator